MLAASVCGLSVVQAQQAGERNRLGKELDMAEQVLSALETEQASSWEEEKEMRLSGARADLDTARAELSRPADSIIANEALFEIARISAVTLTEITAFPPSNDDLAGLTCSALPFTVTAEGGMSELLDFTARLNTDLVNGIVRSATLTVPERPTGGDSSVNIQLIIYTYQGE